MNVITGIMLTTRPLGRFEVEVDGATVAVLTLDMVERLGLVVGLPVSGLEERIALEAAQLSVYDRALSMLAFRARASVELARLLVRKGADKRHVDWAIERLQAQGLLNDGAFAQSFTRAKVLGANHSRRRVQQELARKGVSRAVTDTAIQTVFDEEGVDQGDVVLQAARRKLRTMAGLDPAVRRRRLYGFLARRGYDLDDIKQAMRAVGDELRPDDGSVGVE